MRQIFGACSGLFFSLILHGATLPANFTESLVASGLTSPTSMTIAPDGRIFVCEQGGQLRVIKDGVLLPAPFVSISVNSMNERGLLGVELDPNFAVNSYVYVYYTTSSAPIHNRVSRFTANGDVALAGSELPILDLDTLGLAFHNGGAIRFGPDGKLFVATGENGVGSNAQSFANLLGKILRISSDGMIPLDNPFYSTASGVNRAIWAIGLRNPFVFAFQPETGRMFINDVGAGTFEEIDDGLAGSNYGWPATEGPTSDPLYRAPLFSYTHSITPTQGCAITGGAFYNPSVPQLPASFIGKYLFADLCSGWIRKFNPATLVAEDFVSGISNPVDLRVESSGRLLYLERGTGSVKRIQSTLKPADRPGIFRQGFFWLEDVDGDTQFAFPTDRAFAFGGVSGDVPITGDWNGDGRSEIGIYRPFNGLFILDLDGDRRFTANDRVINFGAGVVAGDLPVIGDWNGDGISDVGLFRAGFLWILDSNGNGTFEGGVDSTIALGGISGDVPVVGDWNGDGRSKIGIFRQGYFWILDKNGNGILDSINIVGGDLAFAFGGIPGDVPIVGDWSGNGISKVGLFRSGFFWILDRNGNGTFDGLAPSQDQAFAFGGIANDRPIPGKW